MQNLVSHQFCIIAEIKYFFPKFFTAFDFPEHCFAEKSVFELMQKKGVGIRDVGQSSNKKTKWKENRERYCLRHSSPVV